MNPTNRLLAAVLVLIVAALASVASAALPPPTPAQAQAQAAKKAQADAQAERDKQELLAVMDALSARWRAKAIANGWKIHPPVPVLAQAGAVTAPAKQAGSAAAVAAPVTSEKYGTAPPSADVKKAPSPAPVADARRK
jgi:hypothetical protein